MNPAWSVIIFTTLAGAAQGLVVALALARLAGITVTPAFMSRSLTLALVMLMVALGASFLHLGRPERAWRAVLMWRTSWLSREVIVLPGFIALVALWWWLGAAMPSWGLLAIIAVAALLWWCTAMIYACLRFIQEWAHPLTMAGFVLIGLSSGGVLVCALAALAGEAELLQAAAPWALRATIAALIVRLIALRRNARLKHKSTLQSATGIKARVLRQTSMGMSAGAFNTREFFHRAAAAALGQVKLTFIVLGFVLPTVLMLWALNADSVVLWLAACAAQLPGLAAERWFFFAQARHPQNLYYQVVS
jgi:sulfite dehydrogenase (quinone) subunit SoeC